MIIISRQHYLLYETPVLASDSGRRDRIILGRTNKFPSRTTNRVTVRQKSSLFLIQVTWKKSNGDVLDPETLPDNFKLSEDRLTLTINVSHTLFTNKSFKT